MAAGSARGVVTLGDIPATGHFPGASTLRGPVLDSPDEVAPDFIDLVAPASLQRRLTRAEEIANFMVYLASPLASATNGAVVSAEGGTRPAIW